MPRVRYQGYPSSLQVRRFHHLLEGVQHICVATGEETHHKATVQRKLTRNLGHFCLDVEWLGSQSDIHGDFYYYFVCVGVPSVREFLDHVK